MVNAYNRPPVAILSGGSRILSIADPLAQYEFDASKSFAYGQVNIYVVEKKLSLDSLTVVTRKCAVMFLNILQERTRSTECLD